MRFIFTGVLIIALLLSACGLNEQGVIEKFNSRVSDFQQKFAPDPSLNLLTAKLEKEKGEWILRGETTLPEARQSVLALVDSLLGQSGYANEFLALPEAELGDSTYAIVAVSVAHLRRDPGHSAEMVDQTILGNTLRLLKRHRSWYMVQTHYGYIGWVQRGSLVRTNEAGIRQWENAESLRVKTLHGFVFSEKNPDSTPVSDLVINALLQKVSTHGKWTKVRLPRGDEGFVMNELVQVDDNVELGREQKVKKILETASSMMGVPYLWGGNSSKGNDCSGFTQTVFKTAHIQLPRDARQQVHLGKEIIPDETFGNVLPGDLFFFGSKERITHVGISLGGAEFIHQSSWVHVNSLDPEAENFNPYRKRTFVTIKRIF